VTLQHNGKSKAIQAGAIVLATGSEELKPHGKYMYGEDPRVMTQLELEKKLKEGEFDYKKIVMIQCVGARDETYPGCSRSCCLEAVKNAIIIKKKRPDAQVFLLYRDMMTFGKFEEYYRRSQIDYGIRYLRYTSQKPPNLTKENGDLYVQVHDTLLGDSVKIKADTVILTAPQVPSKGVEELQEILKVPLSSDGFFMEAHAKIKPLEFTSDGIYLCGACQSPKELPLIISQASGVASRATSMLSKGTMYSETITAEGDEEKCIGCGLCTRLCPYGAPIVEEGKAKILKVLCKGCGLCAAGCPAMAITIRHFTDKQIVAQMEAMLI
jgi:heterodisulfide reductase subunit A